MRTRTMGYSGPKAERENETVPNVPRSKGADRWVM
jgi:hypothetical protein